MRTFRSFVDIVLLFFNFAELKFFWPAELWEEAAEGEPQPGQREPHQGDPPADQLDHEELRPNPAH